MKINTTNPDGMFDLIVFGEEPRELLLDPALILGQDMIGFTNCVFYTRLAAKNVNFLQNKWYSEWFDLEQELFNKTIICKDKTSLADIPFTAERQIAFHERMDQDISFRYEVGFEDNGQPVIKVRAVNLSRKTMTSQWLKGNVPTVHVTSIEVKTLELAPPIETHGYPLPFYPVLFTHSQITMPTYEKYVLRVMPGIMTQVQRHTNFSAQELKPKLKEKTLCKNTCR